MHDSQPHWLERYQPFISTFVAVVVGVLSLLPFVSGMWQRAATAPYIAGAAYLATTIALDFIIALSITREERRRALLGNAAKQKSPRASPPPEPERRAPLPHAIARIRAR